MAHSAHVQSLGMRWKLSTASSPTDPDPKLSSCRCHLGQIILLDTVKELGWGVDPRTHPINVIIDRLLGPKSEWFGPAVEASRGEVNESGWGWWGCKHKKHSLPEPILEEEDCLVSYLLS